MKRVYILICLLVQTASVVIAQTVPNSVDAILQSIAKNNKQIKAQSQEAKAQKMENRSANNLADPTVSYASTYSNAAEGGHSTEFIAAQSFDFPTQYIARGRQAALQNEVVDMQALAARRDILLKAKMLCLDIIMLNKESEFLKKRAEMGKELTALMRRKKDLGDANAIELNKLKMELMDLNTEIAQNDASHRTALQQLLAMNDNMPLEMSLSVYPQVKPVADYDSFRDELIASDIDIQTMTASTKATEKQVSVQRQSWLPKLEVGFRRNTTSEASENGFVVGGSLPIFENRKKVGIAKARAVSARYMQEAVKMERENQVMAMYNEMQQMKSAIDAYDLGLMYDYLDLLSKSLRLGQISMIEYFVEAEDTFGKLQYYFQLENRYQRLMAEVYSFLLP